MAEVIRYVDPDATGTGDGTSWTDAYTSLSACEAGERTDLVTDGDWMHIYVRGSNDTTDVEFSSSFWTTDADHYILIEAASSDYADKSGWDTNKHEHSVTGAPCIEMKGTHVKLKGLQLESDNSGCVKADQGASNIEIIDCRLRDSGGSTNRGVYINNSSTTVKMENCIVTGFPYDGIWASDCADLKVYNCVVYDNWYDGIEFDAGSGTIKNCAVFNSTSSSDFDIAGGASVTIDYCASDDGDGTNSVSPSGGDWTNEFSDPANGDFTLLNTGNLYDAGVGPGIDSDVPSTDIEGDAKSGNTCDIGVDEYVGGTTHSVAVSDGVTFSDSTSGSLTIPVSVADGISLGDSAGGVLDIPITLADGVVFSDSTSGNLNIPATIADGIVLTDAIAGAFTFRVTLADGIILSDQATEGGVISVSISDGVIFSDSASASLRILETITDGVVFSDSADGSLTIQAEIADGVTFSDAINTAFRYVVSISDGIVLSDVVVDSSVLASGKVSVTISAKSASVTITARRPVVNITAKQPDVSFDAN